MKFEHNVRLLERALRLLERLDAPDAARRGLALKELAQAADISPASAYRLLQTMAAFGYVRQDRKHRYYLGRAARVLGAGDRAVERLREIAAPAVRRLQQATGETAVLAVFHAGMRRTVLTAESRRDLRAGAEPGADRRLFDTATGRVLLSLLAEKEGEQLRLELDPAGALWAECPDAAAFRRRLAGIRRRGYAVCRRPRSGVTAVAAPIAAESAAVPAALGVYFPAFRTPLGSEDACARLVKQTAADIAMQWRAGEVEGPGVAPAPVADDWAAEESEAADGRPYPDFPPEDADAAGSPMAAEVQGGPAGPSSGAVAPPVPPEMPLMDE